MAYDLDASPTPEKLQRLALNWRHYISPPPATNR